MAKTVHKMCNTRLYHIWNSMKQRCENPKTINYKYYGAKGISVCNEWRNSFIHSMFGLWLMGTQTNSLSIAKTETGIMNHQIAAGQQTKNNKITQVITAFIHTTARHITSWSGRKSYKSLQIRYTKGCRADGILKKH